MIHNEHNQQSADKSQFSPSCLTFHVSHFVIYKYVQFFLSFLSFYTSSSSPPPLNMTSVICVLITLQNLQESLLSCYEPCFSEFS